VGCEFWDVVVVGRGIVGCEFWDVGVPGCVSGWVTRSGHVLRGYGIKSDDAPSREMRFN